MKRLSLLLSGYAYTTMCLSLACSFALPLPYFGVLVVVTPQSADADSIWVQEGKEEPLLVFRCTKQNALVPRPPDPSHHPLSRGLFSTVSFTFSPLQPKNIKWTISDRNNSCFKWHATLSSMMKSHIVLMHPALNMNFPFVHHIHTVYTTPSLPCWSLSYDTPWI